MNHAEEKNEAVKVQLKKNLTYTQVTSLSSSGEVKQVKKGASMSNSGSFVGQGKMAGSKRPRSPRESTCGRVLKM